MARRGRPRATPHDQEAATQAVAAFNASEVTRRRAIAAQEQALAEMCAAGMQLSRIAEAIDWPLESTRRALENLELVPGRQTRRPKRRGPQTVQQVVNTRKRKGSILFGP